MVPTDDGPRLSEFDQLQTDPLAERALVPGAGAYVTGVDFIERLSHWISTALRAKPRSALVFSGPRAWQAAGEHVAQSLSDAGTAVYDRRFPGECTDDIAAEYAELVRTQQVDIIVGAGGGKVLDTAKLAGAKANVPVVTVPTIASNCAAWTPLSVVYDASGKRVRTEFFDHAPLLTFVDYAIIAAAPEDYLLWGIGDTVVKWYEARLSARFVPSSPMVNGGLSLARVTRDQLLKISEGAVAAVRSGLPDAALAGAVDTIIPVSGLVGGIGGEATRVAAAHGFYNAWTMVNSGEHASHGELVAFGLLVQLLLEDAAPDELALLLEFYRRVGLPQTLKQLGCSDDPARCAQRVAEAMATDVYLNRLDLDLGVERLTAAILRADGASA